MPTMPSRLPETRWPSIQVGDQPVHLAGRRMRSPSVSRRGTARISAIVMSAVSSVSTSGVLVTVMPRSLRAAEIDMVEAGAVVGDQLQPVAGMVDHCRGRSGR